MTGMERRVNAGLLATKLHCPSLMSKWVARPRLIRRLNEGLESGRRLTLVSAPAGFGKTFCIADWVNTLKMPVTWLSLDPADDDPGRFFSYFIAALQKVEQTLGEEIAGILRAGQLPPEEIISITLVNAIMAIEHPFIVVLDDFHLIQDAFTLKTLETLVDSALPCLHLVLLTREDPSLPLARLRANNQLTEIRAGDLRFNAAETELFLNEVMALSLSSEDAAKLGERTEGWVVGLHLAGLSIRDRQNPSEYIAALSGSHRFILNYLMEEVLNRQPQEVRQFLLQTSILERLNGDLCDAVTGRVDSHALIEELYKENLFIISLDDVGRWYRYHHLFADLLRDLQSAQAKEVVSALHRRASAWYVQTGSISEAIQHALAAADYAQAVHLIESHAMDMLMQWHVKTVEGWMQAIPVEWCAQSLRANLAFAWLNLMRGNHTGAMSYLMWLQNYFSGAVQPEEVDLPLKARWLALQCMLLNAQGKMTESLALAHQALEITTETDIHVHSMIYLGLAGAYQQMDEYPRAREAYQMIIRLGQASGNSIIEMLGVSGLALLAIQHGELHLAYEIASQGIDRLERSGALPPISTAIYGELGVLHYQWHQLEQAHQYFLRAIQVSTLSGYSDAELYYGVILSRLYQISGDLTAAEQEIRKTVELMRVEAPAAVREEVIAQQVRIELALDRLPAAEAVLKGCGFSFRETFSYPALHPADRAADRPGQAALTRPVGLLYISALRILLQRARTRRDAVMLKSGIDLADRLVADASGRGLVLIVLETLLLRARMHIAQGDQRAGVADVMAAVELAEPEGFISVFIEEGAEIASALQVLLAQGTPYADYVRTILAAFSSQSRPVKESAQGLVDALTERELDVLRGMAEGLKYEEISNRLFISLNTVRTHVKAIYGKLGVNNRTRAIETAQNLGVL